MKTPAMTVLFAAILATDAYAGLPKIEDLNEGERITIKVSGSEPGFWSCEYIFEGRSVTLREDKKLLGKIVISDADAVKPDNFLYRVRRARRPSPGTLGAPVYHIVHEEDGNKVGEWRYEVGGLRASKKPTLALWKLRERLKK